MFENFHQHVASLVTLDRAAFDYLFSKLVVKALRQGEFLLKEGMVCSFIAYVNEGTLRSYLTKGDKEINTEFFMTGSFASAFTSFLQGRRTALTIQAIEDSTLFLIPKPLLEELYRQNPAWLALGKYIFEQEFVKKCRRETSFLQEDAQARYLTLLEQYPFLEQKVSLYHIASYLGIQPETLSRIRAGKLSRN